MEQPRFQVGQTVLLRDIWQDKILTVKPEIVVQDTPELMVFYLPEGTICKQPVTIDGTCVRGKDRFLFGMGIERCGIRLERALNIGNPWCFLFSTPVPQSRG